MCPFEADLGYVSRSVLDLTLPANPEASSEAPKIIEHQQSLPLEAQDAMAAAQQRMRRSFDRNRRHLAFSVGDEVLLDSQNRDLAHVGDSMEDESVEEDITVARILAGDDELGAENTDSASGFKVNEDHSITSGARKPGNWEITMRAH
ncbi:hypothetical protein PC129_g9795 [Phytophthora cactorum]|uniref:Uncharacterized protein n=2 Tax=Phytophthora cactorum TaxID=29920 RepID=A0A329RLG7_9STRA|nr:hypothetical protein PC112_g11216 [Phytophthora cactorum]KAG2835651.1 hypothetical protein PC111_g5332 [Phytophthora cactorum]KAG2901919.1 hypothetical protein PC114_g12968 [Phytophthora cactorum]KAG2979265.1 hypothetical protein PC118_g11859 [Phytophthora cactorum]KAG3011243.1 hypothetical protein PC119_g13283 [Phytophthora cactorum]